jgi:hypothetical protein
VAKR